MQVEWKNCFRVCISIFLLYICMCYFNGFCRFLVLLCHAALPLCIGLVIAYLVNIIMRVYERHYFPRAQKKWLCKSRRPVCLCGAYLTLAAVVALIVLLVMPQLISCVRVIIAAFPGVMAYITAKVHSWGIMPEDIALMLEEIDWKSWIGNAVHALTAGVGNVMGVVVSAISSVFSGIVTCVLSFIFSFYLLYAKEKLKGQATRFLTHYLPQKFCRKMWHVLAVLDDCFHSYIVGQCTEAVILGVLCALGMLILRLPYAAMIGALVGFTALIPIAGGYIGMFVGAFMLLTHSPIQALVFIIFLAVLQQIEGNLIYPKVVGASLGISGIWVLAAVTIGGSLMGVLGMLLGVPLAAAVYRLLREDMNRPCRWQKNTVKSERNIFKNKA